MPLIAPSSPLNRLTSSLLHLARHGLLPAIYSVTFPRLLGPLLNQAPLHLSSSRQESNHRFASVGGHASVFSEAPGSG
jgi:hypothetical protein